MLGVTQFLRGKAGTVSDATLLLSGDSSTGCKSLILRSAARGVPLLLSKCIQQQSNVTSIPVTARRKSKAACARNALASLLCDFKRFSSPR